MGKRRLNKQQSNRIKNQHKSYQELVDSAINSNFPEQRGLIISRFGTTADVEDEDGTIMRCNLRQNLGDFVAGDHVIWKKIDRESGVILALCPRKSILGRPDKSGKLKPIAANLTQIMIIIAVKPEFSSTLIDSYFVIAESLHLKPVLVINKCDLKHKSLLNAVSVYKELNYSYIETSIKSKKGLSDLKASLNNHTSVFVGQSGVGKSSLISMLLPNESIATGEISKTTHLGRHTTTMSKFYHLDTGGSIIDSPGIREFGLWHMNHHEIARGFIEFKPYLSLCKFRDCKHQSEPGCAILAALNENKINKIRYQSYIKLCQSHFS